MNVDGVEVLVEGSGRPIVMIHGWPDTQRLWDAQVAGLKDRFRCVRFTLPGFEPGGKARAFEEILATVRKIVESACPGERVTLLLHDWGCFFGYQFAARHPELVERVVGVDIGDAGSRENRTELGVRGLFIVLAYQYWLALAWRIGGRIGDAMARAMAKAMRWPGDRGRIGSWMCYPYAMRWFRAHGGLPPLRAFRPQVPMLFLYAERKPIMFHSRAWAQRIAAAPGSSVLAFPTGHWIMVERPAQFNAALLAWLGEPDRAPG